MDDRSDEHANVVNNENKIRQTLFLVIYAPRRGILEVSNLLSLLSHEISCLEFRHSACSKQSFTFNMKQNHDKKFAHQFATS